MSTAYDVLRLIEQIGETSSRTEKEELLGLLVAMPLGKFVLEWAYNPFITFGVKAVEHGSGGTFNIQFRDTLVKPLLERLAKRELTGRAAEAEIRDVMGALDADGARLLYLILSKDLKCGIGPATINAVMPGLIPTFAVMRANAYESKRVKSWPQKAEFKLDGQRNTFLCHNGNGRFFTRAGNPVPALDFMVPIVMKAAHIVVGAGRADLNEVLLNENGELDFMLDGEAMMGLFEDTGKLRRAREAAIGAELHLYDFMSFGDFDAPGAVGKPLVERRRLLSDFVRLAKASLPHEEGEMLQLVPQFFANNEREAMELFETARSMSLAKYLARGNPEREAELLKTTIDKATGKPKVLEGIMLKDPNGLYEKKKSNGWLKIKAEETEDLRVIGWFEGEVGTKLEGKFGGYLVDHNGVEVRVGGGFSDAEREAALVECLAATAGQEPVIKKGIKTYYFTGRLIEVEYNEVTPDGSLRHPRFVRYRDDKDGETETREAA